LRDGPDCKADSVHEPGEVTHRARRRRTTVLLELGALGGTVSLVSLVGAVLEATWLLAPVIGLLLLLARGILAAVRRQPPGPVSGGVRAASVLCAATWLELAAVSFDAVPVMLGHRNAFLATVVVLDVVLAATALALPGRLAPVTRSAIALGALLVLGITSLQVHVFGPAGSAVALASPVHGTWYALQAGRSPLLNHHWPVAAQHDALDIVVLRNGRSHPANATAPSDYYAYGQPVYAPVSGTVTEAVDGRPDQPIGEGDTTRLFGNRLVLTVHPGVWIALDHLRPGSLRVQEGDRVAAGQQVAEVGNSGNTSEPHLHLQLLDLPRQNGQGRSRELLLTDVALLRGGRLSHPDRADLRRNDTFVAGPAS
jgi:murein DD-endopeptidase MepM/ murein hydrolase activator NlpD